MIVLRMPLRTVLGWCIIIFDAGRPHSLDLFEELCRIGFGRLVIGAEFV